MVINIMRLPNFLKQPVVKLICGGKTVVPTGISPFPMGATLMVPLPANLKGQSLTCQQIKISGQVLGPVGQGVSPGAPSSKAPSSTGTSKGTSPTSLPQSPQSTQNSGGRAVPALQPVPFAMDINLKSPITAKFGEKKYQITVQAPQCGGASYGPQ
jgi:hypothetical protein